MLCSPPGVRVIPGVGDGHGWYPCKPVSGLMSAGDHEAGELAPPSSGAPFPSVESQWAPSPTTKTSVALKEKEVTMQEVPLLTGPSEAIADPLGSCQLQAVLQGGPPIPCHIPQLTLTSGSFK